VVTKVVVAETPYFFAILLILLIPVILYPFFDSYTLVHTGDILANLAGVLHNKLITTWHGHLVFFYYRGRTGADQDQF
jgi:hypothetical protein